MPGLTPYNKKNSDLDKRPTSIFEMLSNFESFINETLFPTLFGNQVGMNVDIKEYENEVIVHADLPGINREQIDIQFKNNLLTISVASDNEYNVEKQDYIRKERRSGAISRSFSIDNVNDEAIKAKFENGLLSIVLPKKIGGMNRNNKINIE